MSKRNELRRSGLGVTSRRGGKAGTGAVLAAVEGLELRRLMSVGGGVAGAGFQGQYFNNADLTGSPTFSRRDVRIDFDWGTTLKPGGSISPGFRDVGTDNWSARWTGVVVPKFSETYTLKVVADDGARLFIRPTGSPTWTTLVDQWSSAGTYTAAYAMTAGTNYDVRLEYRELTGSAAVKLRWSSPSAPEESIDPIIETGINNPDWRQGFTNIVQGARNTWQPYNGGTGAMDAAGWPTGDAEYVFQESLNQGLGIDPLMRGRVSFSFNGRADVSLFGNFVSGSLTSSYNSASNLTTGSFVMEERVTGDSNASNIRFANTDRDGVLSGGVRQRDGITNLRLMLPTAPDSNVSYPTTGGQLTPDAPVFTPQMVDAMSKFTVVRHQFVANQQRDWSERTPPTYFNQGGGTVSGPKLTEVNGSPIGGSSGNSASWEHKIMLANESGSDLMLSVPLMATDDYVTQLARVLRFGSDANGVPYTGPTANPAHPPLNPNLHVYLELQNELWNFAGVFYTDFGNLNAMARADLDANNANAQAMTADGLSAAKNGSNEYVNIVTFRQRKQMQRTIQISELFRSVYGDANMTGTSAEPKIRTTYMWQYNNLNQTAQIPLTWAEAYYSNGSGVNYVATPKPLNHFLYAAGGATYYGANEPNGLTTLNPDMGFDAATVSTGYTQNPSGTGYTFTGTAGIARDAGTGDDIPVPFNGSNVGYIRDDGRISFQVTIPSGGTSNVYAVAFKAHNRFNNTTLTSDGQRIRAFVSVNGGTFTDMSARTFNQSNGVVPVVQDAANVPGSVDATSGWRARNVFWTDSQYYYTRTFTANPGDVVTIEMRGGSTAGSDKVAFLENFQVTSVDALYASGFPGGGEATGQPAGSNVRTALNGTAAWANAYGLKFLAYEGGWSLGGDDGGSPLQLEAKYRDPRTVDVQRLFMDWFAEAGGVTNVHGTYAQWPSWGDFFAEQGILNVSQYPIIQGMAAEANELPATITNAVGLPAVLTPTNRSITLHSQGATGNLHTRGAFVNWNVSAPRTAVYGLSLTPTSSGTVTVFVNGVAVASNAAVTAGTPLAIAGVSLTAGTMHTVRVVNTGSSGVTFSQIAVTQAGAPAAPALNSAVEGSGNVTLGWSAVAGAASYVVRYGTVTQQYVTRVPAGANLSKLVTGLTNGTQYYFAVSAVDASGRESLPSNERGVIPLASGQVGQLATYEFTGYNGNGSGAPNSSSGRVTVSNMTRGSGVVAETNTGGLWIQDSFSQRPAGTSPANNAWAQSLTQAQSWNQFVTFTVTPTAGNALSLTNISLSAFFQSNGNANATVALSTRVGAGPEVMASSIPVAGRSGPQTYSFDLAPGAVQDVTSAVTVRVYVWGGNNFTYIGIGSGTGSTASDLVVNGSIQTTPPAAPTGLGALALGATSVRVSWTDAAVTEDGFVLERATDAGFTQNVSSVTLPSSAGPGSTVTYDDLGLTPGVQYFYRVRAFTGGGNSAWVGPVSATTSLPATPAGLGAVALNSSSVRVTFTDASTDETGFVLERATDAGFTTGLTTVNLAASAGSGAVLTYDDTGLTPETTYFYRVSSAIGAVTSPAAGPVSVATPRLPFAPTGLAGTVVLPFRIDLTWDAIDTLAQSVLVQRSTDGGSNFATVATLPRTAVSYSDTTVPSTAYVYRLVAVAANGDVSPVSGTVSLTSSQGPYQLVSEPFGYSAGTLLGQSGGTGWAGPWAVSGNTAAAYTVATSPLVSYPGVDAGTRVVRFTGSSSQTAGRTIDTTAFTGFTRDRDGNVSGGTGSIWMSALVRVDRLSTAPVWVGLSNQNSNTSASPVIAIGKFAASTTASVRLGNRTVSLGVPLVQGANNLLAVKVDYSARTVSFYINPSSVGGLEPAATLTLPFSTVSGSRVAFRHFLYFGGTQSGDSALGPVRFGERYLDVTPAPAARPGLGLPTGSVSSSGTRVTTSPMRRTDPAMTLVAVSPAQPKFTSEVRIVIAASEPDVSATAALTGGSAVGGEAFSAVLLR